MYKIWLNGGANSWNQFEGYEALDFIKIKDQYWRGPKHTQSVGGFALG